MKQFKEFLNESQDVSNSEILDVIDALQNLIKKIKSSKKGSKMFTLAGPIVKELHSLMNEELTNESKKSDILSKEIDKSINKIDDSMSYEDFALAVGSILKDQYGTHNYKLFMAVLHKDLGI
jgi:hypothetical protein